MQLRAWIGGDDPRPRRCQRALVIGVEMRREGLHEVRVRVEHGHIDGVADEFANEAVVGEADDQR